MSDRIREAKLNLLAALRDAYIGKQEDLDRFEREVATIKATIVQQERQLRDERSDQAKAWGEMQRLMRDLEIDGVEVPVVEAAPDVPAQHANGAVVRDYVEIGKVIARLRLDGLGGVSKRLATHYGMPESTVRNWMTKCSRDGLIPKNVDVDEPPVPFPVSSDDVDQASTEAPTSVEAEPEPADEPDPEIDAEIARRRADISAVVGRTRGAVDEPPPPPIEPVDKLAHHRNPPTSELLDHMRGHWCAEDGCNAGYVRPATLANHVTIVHHRLTGLTKLEKMPRRK